MVFFSSRRRHTRCALVTGVQTCALPISGYRAIAAACHVSTGKPPNPETSPPVAALWRPDCGGSGEWVFHVKQPFRALADLLHPFGRRCPGVVRAEIPDMALGVAAGIELAAVILRLQFHQDHGALQIGRAHV